MTTGDVVDAVVALIVISLLSLAVVIAHLASRKMLR
jgi:hypothetical protein